MSRTSDWVIGIQEEVKGKTGGLSSQERVARLETNVGHMLYDYKEAVEINQQVKKAGYLRKVLTEIDAIDPSAVVEGSAEANRLTALEYDLEAGSIGDEENGYLAQSRRWEAEQKAKENKFLLEQSRQQAKGQAAFRKGTGFAIGAAVAATHAYVNMISETTGDALKERKLKRNIDIASKGTGLIYAIKFLSPTAALVMGAGFAVQAGMKAYSETQINIADTLKSQYTREIRGIMSYKGSR